VLLGQILTGGADLQAMVEQRAVDAVMVLAPRQAARRHAGNRLFADRIVETGVADLLEEEATARMAAVQPPDEIKFATDSPLEEQSAANPSLNRRSDEFLESIKKGVETPAKKGSAVDAFIRAMALGEANAFQYDWRYRARPEQLPPDGSWQVWLLLAGRGFGKTRSGAEWVRVEVQGGASSDRPGGADGGRRAQCYG
jgi:hypothetical protein